MREARVEAWKNVGIILNGFWDVLVKMLTSGEPIQVILGLIVIIGVVVGVATGIRGIILRIMRNAAYNV